MAANERSGTSKDFKSVPRYPQLQFSPLSPLCLASVGQPQPVMASEHWFPPKKVSTSIPVPSDDHLYSDAKITTHWQN